MAIQVGDKLPSVELRYKTEDGVQTINSEELFSGKRVVLFALPGAFTPTCSASHLPGYVVQADSFFARGIDSIVCLSVNDAHVMHAWGIDQNVDDKIQMIADGSAHFTLPALKEVFFQALDEDGLAVQSMRSAVSLSGSPRCWSWTELFVSPFAVKYASSGESSASRMRIDFGSVAVRMVISSGSHSARVDASSKARQSAPIGTPIVLLLFTS